VGGSNGLPMNSGSANSVTDNIPLTGSSGNGVTNNLPLVGSSGSGVTNNPSAAWLEWQQCNQQPAVPRLNYEQPPHRRRDRQRRRGHRHGPLPCLSVSPSTWRSPPSSSVLSSPVRSRTGSTIWDVPAWDRTVGSCSMWMWMLALSSMSLALMLGCMLRYVSHLRGMGVELMRYRFTLADSRLGIQRTRSRAVTAMGGFTCPFGQKKKDRVSGCF